MGRRTVRGRCLSLTLIAGCGAECLLCGAPAAPAQNTNSPASAAPPAPKPSTTGPQSPHPPAVEQQPGAPPPSQQTLPARAPLLQFGGSFFERYRADTNHNNGSHDARSSVTYGNILADVNVAPNYTLYLRLGGELVSPGGVGRDFNTAYYQGLEGWRGALAFDQYGVIYHDAAKGLVITLGRQDEPLDATGTMYDQSFKVGLHTFLDGMSVIQRIGNGTVEGDAFSEDQYRLVDGIGRATCNGLYAIRGTYQPMATLTLGALAARFVSSAVNQAAGIETTTNAESDVSWQAAPNLLLKAEYGFSSARSRNELYYGLVKYSFTPRDSLTTYTYRVGQNADVGEDSGYPNDYRGTRYFLEHDFDLHTSLILYHETDRALYGPGRSDSDQVTLVYTF